MRNKEARTLIAPKKDKKYKYLWSKMQKPEVIRRGWRNLRKGKTKRPEVRYIDSNFDEEAEKMRLMISKTVPEHPDEGYQPPKKRKTKIVNEHGKRREAHLADIREQWYFHIIVEVLKPIVTRRLSKNACGCIPGRGAHSGKRTIEKWIKAGFRYIYKADVRKFYDSTRISIVIRALRRDIADERFLYCIEKIYRYVAKGILIGLFISPWIANYVLATVDEAIEGAGGKMVRYVDDIVIVSNSKKQLKKIHETVRGTLSKLRLKLKRTWQIFKFDYETRHKTKDGKNIHIGRPLDFMGFLFFRDRTVIRKSIMIRATRTARRLKKAKDKGRRYYIKMARGMVSRMGWFKYTASRECYLKHIKPYVNIGKLKKIVSKLDKEANKNDRVEAGNMLAVSRRAAGDSSRALYAA